MAMLQTIEVEIDTSGRVKAIDPIGRLPSGRALLTLLESADEEDRDDSCGGMLDFDNCGEGIYDKAVAIVARERKATTSYIQRRLEIGYNRAARLIERMEEEGVISRANYQCKREVLLPERAKAKKRKPASSK